jgi:3-oxoacyl-[acyl-carrier protein] reductase
MNLDGACIVITGGASGLGYGIAEALVRRNARPILLDRNEGALHAAGEALQCPAYRIELTDPEQVDQTVDEICAAHGVPQGLVNSAGVLRSAPLLNLLNREQPRHSLELWNEVLNINLTAVFLMTRALTEQMVRKRVRGAIISMSSVSARGNAGQSAYSAAKAGVEALTRVWAKELGPLGLRFAAIAPGFVDTPSTHAALTEELLEDWRRKTPLRRLGQVEDIAKAALYILENDLVTGTVLEVSGGLSV